MEKKTLTKKIIITVLLALLVVIAVVGIVNSIDTINTTIIHMKWLLENEYELNLSLNSNFVKKAPLGIAREISFICLYVTNICFCAFTVIKMLKNK